MQCDFIKKDGTRCHAKAINESSFCYFHNPDSQQSHQLAVRTGGLNSKKNNVALAKRAIQTPQDVILLIEETLNLLRAGEIHPNYSNSIFIGSNALLKALEQVEVYQRVKELEHKIHLLAK